MLRISGAVQEVYRCGSRKRAGNGADVLKVDDRKRDEDHLEREEY